MKDDPENLTARESFEIITAMIKEAKGNIQRNNFFFLFWGWVVVAANAGMFLLQRLDYPHPYIVWLITLPAWGYTFYRIFTRRDARSMSTHFDRISMWVWISFGVIIFTLVAFGSKINFQLSPVILLVTAIPTMVSGVILTFRPLMVGAVIFWILGMICFIVERDIQPLVSALAIAGGYLVPGSC